MDALALVAIPLFLAAAYYLFFAKSDFPALPGPVLRDYLPGGPAVKLVTDPESLLDTMTVLKRIHGDIFQVRLGPTRTVVVSSPADLAHAVSSSIDFDRPQAMITAFDAILPRSLFTMDRTEHMRARRLLRQDFNHALLPHFHGPMTEAVREIVEKLRIASVPRGPEGQCTAPPVPVNINNLLGTVSLRVILNVALGGAMVLSERSAFAEDLDTLLNEAVVELLMYPVRQVLTFTGTRDVMFRTRERIRQVAQRMIDARLAESAKMKADRAPDLLDAILALDDHDKARRMSEVSFFIVAGAHTVSVGIAWTLFNLCKNPRVASKLYQEIDSMCEGRASHQALSREDVMGMEYLHNVWKETMRITPSVSGVMRRTTKEVALKGSGVTLPKGTQVYAMIHAAQMDERYFTDADQFIPERWGSKEGPGDANSAPVGAFLPFGDGLRGCAGQFLAEYEGPLILAELLRNFSFKLACPAEEIRRRSGMVEVPRWSSKHDGNLDMGVPLIVTQR